MAPPGAASQEDASSQSSSSTNQQQQQQPRSEKIPKISILRLEMSMQMKEEAVTKLIDVFQTNPNAIEKDIATEMKKHFDVKYGQTWHCIVGKGFGCSIAYDTQFLLFFKADQHHVLLFKSTE
jgi:dynein light chain LC8-type